jgi:hypothetical protein
MRRTRIVTLAGSSVITAVLLMAWKTPPQTFAQGVAAPVVLLEATNWQWGIGGYRDKPLIVRLTTDGRIEWDAWTAPGVLKRHAGSVAPSVIAEVQALIDNLDRTKLREKMGPYFMNIDTGEDLHIRARAKAGRLRFTLANPWYTPMPRKQMPSDIRALFCQIDDLYSQNIKRDRDPACANVPGLVPADD